MKKNLYLGIDVGGTKILAALITSGGKILARERVSTPRNKKSRHTLKTILQLIEGLLEGQKITRQMIRAIGIGVPGIVNPGTGIAVLTPNMNLSGTNIVKPLKKRFKAPVALENDVNLGILGEQWLGAARHTGNAVGIFTGTGIGGGIILEGKLIHGAHQAAGEIGHMIVQPEGPVCSCGNKGCLEAVAGRSAIERQIRKAVKRGRKTIVTKLLDNDLSIIKSKVLKKALHKKDKLVREIMIAAAKALGLACISIKHLYDPEVIVLGGGLIEACGDFILPIVEKVFASDKFLKKQAPCKIILSQLEDDAVVLGAVALAKNNA